jgi:hypothetical protein
MAGDFKFVKGEYYVFEEFDPNRKSYVIRVHVPQICDERPTVVTFNTPLELARFYSLLSEDASESRIKYVAPPQLRRKYGVRDLSNANLREFGLHISKMILESRRLEERVAEEEERPLTASQR